MKNTQYILFIVDSGHSFEICAHVKNSLSASGLLDDNHCRRRRWTRSWRHRTDELNVSFTDKKLIKRWDSERELYLRRHCTRTKNTIDSCINSATDCFLQCKFTKFSEITQCDGHYAVQGHSRSPKNKKYHSLKITALASTHSLLNNAIHEINQV